VISSSTGRIKYTGNGVADEFAIPFRFNSNDHINVYRKLEAETASSLLTETTDYTLTGAGDNAGGTCTLVAPLELNAIIAITRTVPLTQENDLNTQGRYSGPVFEGMFDEITMGLQQLQDQIDLAVTADPTETSGASVAFFTGLLEDAQAVVESADASVAAAAASAAAALVSEGNASDSVDDAAAQVALAAAQVGLATTQASNAATSATNALNAQTAAEAAQAAAEDARDGVDIQSWEGTATAGQTVVNITGFTLDTDKDNIQVYVAGNRISPTAFTRTDGDTITLSTGASLNDTLLVISATPLDLGGTAHVHANKNYLDTLSEEWSEIATPTNPASTKHKVYFKSDGKMYRLNSSGTEVEVGAGTSTGGVDLNSVWMWS
jgi:hypothetical protein